MNTMSVAAPGRPFHVAVMLGLPVCAMSALALLDTTPLDFWISNRFYQPAAGFAARDSFWLETVLHDVAKQVLLVPSVLILLGWLASFGVPWLRVWRRPLAYLGLAIGISTGIMPPLKAVTGVHCPWSLREFGGQEHHARLFAQPAPTANPGRCWPGGHASTGFSLFAWYFVLRDRRPRAARVALLAAMALGTAFSLGRIMQGAHFLSHNLWTMLIDWCVCALAYRLMLHRRPSTRLVDVVPGETRNDRSRQPLV